MLGKWKQYRDMEEEMEAKKRVVRGDQGWGELYTLWKAEREAGWVVQGGKEWRVLRPNDVDIIFVQEGGIDESKYNDTSMPGVK